MVSFLDGVVSLGGLYPVGVGAMGWSKVPQYVMSWLVAQFGAHLLSERLFPATYAKLSPLMQSAWNDRIISQMHCVWTATMAWRVVLSGAHPLGHPTGAPALIDAPFVGEWQNVIQWSMSYYVFDLCRMLYNKHVVHIGMDKDFVTNVLHHAIMLVGHTPVVLSRQVIGISAFGYLAEMSTPVLNVRWMMQQAGLTGTPAFLAVTKLLAALFFVFRVLLFPAALVMCLKSGMPWPGKGVHLLLWVLNVVGNVVWMNGLLKSIAKGSKKLREESKRE